jgi:hypothetical protein
VGRGPLVCGLGCLARGLVGRVVVAGAGGRGGGLEVLGRVGSLLGNGLSRRGGLLNGGRYHDWFGDGGEDGSGCWLSLGRRATRGEGGERCVKGLTQFVGV